MELIFEKGSIGFIIDLITNRIHIISSTGIGGRSLCKNKYQNALWDIHGWLGGVRYYKQGEAPRPPFLLMVILAPLIILLQKRRFKQMMSPPRHGVR